MNLQHLLQHPLARSRVTVARWPFIIDLGIGVCGLAIFFALATI